MNNLDNRLAFSTAMGLFFLDVSRMAQHIRLHSTYAPEKLAPQDARDDLFLLSDVLHSLDDLGLRLSQEGPQDVLKACDRAIAQMEALLPAALALGRNYKNLPHDRLLASMHRCRREGSFSPERWIANFKLLRSVTQDGLV